MNLSDIADEIFTELGEPSDISQASIIYWLYTNVGELNALIESDFETTASVITPSPSEIEKQILKKLYTLYFYGRQILAYKMGAATPVQYIVENPILVETPILVTSSEPI